MTRKLSQLRTSSTGRKLAMVASIFTAALISAGPAMSCATDHRGLARVDDSYTQQEGEIAFVGIIERIGPPAPNNDLRLARLDLASWEEKFAGRTPDRDLFKAIPHYAITYVVRVTKVLSGKVPPRVLVEIGWCATVDAWLGDEIRIKGKMVDGIFVSG